MILSGDLSGIYLFYIFGIRISELHWVVTLGLCSLLAGHAVAAWPGL